MTQVLLCPECGREVYRSRSRGFKEKLIKTFSRYRAYRCLECGWHFWCAEGGSRRSLGLHLLQIVLPLIIALLVAAIVLYISAD